MMSFVPFKRTLLTQRTWNKPDWLTQVYSKKIYLKKTEGYRSIQTTENFDLVFKLILIHNIVKAEKLTSLEQMEDIHAD